MVPSRPDHGHRFSGVNSMKDPRLESTNGRGRELKVGRLGEVAALSWWSRCEGEEKWRNTRACSLTSPGEVMSVGA
jgi:hypothetical protein